MKIRNWAVLCIILLFTAAGFAQTKPIVSGLAGYTMSAFQDQSSAAGTLALGASVGVKATPALEVGGEFIYPISGYKFEMTDEVFGKITTTINQMMIGAYGKYFIGTGNLMPFLKAGLGYYTGKPKVEITGHSETAELKSAIGFNFGGGVQTAKGLFAMFTYNIVKRESAGYNSWSVLIGYQIVK